MSGGAFDYNQYRIRDIADEINRRLENEDPDYPYPPDVRATFLEAVSLLRVAEAYAHNIDWFLSGDTGEDSFRKNLAEDLAELAASSTPTACTVCDGAGCPDCCQECQGRGCVKCERVTS